ncbi:hypothetical protein HMPREF9137_0199 [Prevotella denticola F0289]|nr:hypothetical protein HMPREF9137_0199 [Prevotella denticola F0289]
MQQGLGWKGSKALFRRWHSSASFLPVVLAVGNGLAALWNVKLFPCRLPFSCFAMSLCIQPPWTSVQSRGSTSFLGRGWGGSRMQTA